MRRALLVIMAIAPALYAVAMIQYSAVTVPFWDHVELVRLFDKLYGHTLTLHDLLTHQNQPIPLVYRVIYLANGYWTDWDIRSEYLILIATILAGWLAHAALLRRVAPAPSIFWPAMAAVSLLYFSPVGHNNHWWSMMLQLDLTNTLLVVAIAVVVHDLSSWWRHAAAALCAWLAAYTLTNGIFFFLAMIAACQAVRLPSLRPDRFAAFWLVNLVVLLLVFIPGTPLDGAHPSVLHLLQFFLAYLGTPIAFLVAYPYKNQFDIPLSIAWSASCGALVVLASCAALWAGRQALLRRAPGAVASFLFLAVAMASSLATAWGRAEFDSFGVANGNASRYSIFGAYAAFGIIYMLAAIRQPAPSPRLAAAAPWLQLLALLIA